MPNVSSSHNDGYLMAIIAIRMAIIFLKPN